ncbi:Rrf2 family transcriptional regulator [Terrilactibacillus sp. S3-3]|nr:Rrf2 family transcriptional regulator [Terrilactibacillus sp. S3-3]
MNSEFTIAVHSLVFLANAPGRLAKSELIARNVCTNPARIRKIMSALRKEGLVRTKEGLGGGYMLDCDPDEVTLAQVYRTVSCEALKLRWCAGDLQEDCPVSSNIKTVMNQIFDDAEIYMGEYLDRITIGSILKKVKHD